MKQKILIATMGLALAGAAIPAHAIKGFTLDTNGAAPGGTNVTVSDPGFFDGNMLMQNAVTGTAGLGSASADVYAHAFHNLGVAIGELTMTISLPTSTSITGSQMAFSDSGNGRIDLYFDSGADARAANGATPVGNEYVNGVHILSGSFVFGQSFDLSTIPFLFNNNCPTTNSCLPALAANNSTDTISGGGSLVIDIDFDFVNGAYIKEDLTSASLKVSTFSDSLSLPYPNSTLASNKFNGGAAVPNYGDAENDWECANAFSTCDFQSYMNATTDFANVPEPASLLLLGAGLGLIGMRKRAGK